MSITVIDRMRSTRDLEFSFRVQTPGPEERLIEWFLELQPIHIPSGCNATVFREPRLESGYPDIVCVVWSVATAQEWNPKRMDLVRSDFRLMQLLLHLGPSTTEFLEKKTGKKLSDRINRLEAAELIDHIEGKWVLKPLSSSFAVRDIIALEAKMAEWSTAVDQARLNTWFASQSYVLLPHIPRGQRLLDVARAVGIGIWSKSDGPSSVLDSARHDLPRAYASWLFNEWVCRERYCSL